MVDQPHQLRFEKNALQNSTNFRKIFWSILEVASFISTFLSQEKADFNNNIFILLLNTRNFARKCGLVYSDSLKIIAYDKNDG